MPPPDPTVPFQTPPLTVSPGRPSPAPVGRKSGAGSGPTPKAVSPAVAAKTATCLPNNGVVSPEDTESTCQGTPTMLSPRAGARPQTRESSVGHPRRPPHLRPHGALRLPVAGAPALRTPLLCAPRALPTPPRPCTRSLELPGQSAPRPPTLPRLALQKQPSRPLRSSYLLPPTEGPDFTQKHCPPHPRKLADLPLRLPQQSGGRSAPTSAKPTCLRPASSSSRPRTGTH